MLLRVHILAAAWLALASSRLVADPVEGDSRAGVVDKLGAPTGQLSIGDMERLIYPRGEVTLRGGQVTSVKLMSVKEWEASERRRSAERKARAEATAMESQARDDAARKGAEALGLLLDDARWKDAPPEDRMEILNRFAKAFPGADISLVRAECAKRLEARLAEKRRLAELEARVALAEAKAREAEARARTAEAGAESAMAAARRSAQEAQAAARARDEGGLRAYSFTRGGLIDGRPADWCPPARQGASVTIVNGNTIIQTGTPPQGATQRPIVVIPPPKPRQNTP